MESFREIEGMGKLPDDDGEEGETPTDERMKRLMRWKRMAQK